MTDWSRWMPSLRPFGLPGISAAMWRAGYGPLDTPCSPRRSAYTDGPAGDAAFAAAQARWETFCTILLTESQADLSIEWLDLIHPEGVGRCDLCGRSDDHRHADDEYGTFAGRDPETGEPR